MATIIFIISLIVFIYAYRACDTYLAAAISVITLIGMIITGFIIIVSAVIFGHGIGLSEKIKTYEEGKTRIEKEMGTMVNAYMEYEKNNVKRISDKEAVSYVTVIPELKASELVKQEMALYADYDKKVMSLKESQADVKFAKFMLYKIF